jgi:ATP-binding cassette subfamily B protein
VRDLVSTVGLVVRMSVRSDARRVLVATLWYLVGFAAAPLAALAARELTNAALAGRSSAAAFAAALLALVWTASVAFGYVGVAPLFEIGDLNDLAIDQELIALGAGADGIEHLERAGYADRLETLRSGGANVFWAFFTILGLAGVTLQLVFLTVLLGLVAAPLALLPAVAIPGALAGRWSGRHVERAREAAAEQQRLSRHLLELATRPAAGKEIRVFGLAGELRRRHRHVWSEIDSRLSRAEATAGIVRSIAAVCFAAAYLFAAYLAIHQAVIGRRTVGDAVLAIMLATQINAQSAQLVNASVTLESLNHFAKRLRWLREVTIGRSPSQPSLPAPTRLEQGIVLDSVSFRYPGASQPALEDVTLFLPAGSVVAVVGENGAGKTTLTKLLCRFYEPTGGSIEVDGSDMSRFAAQDWRERLTAAFQDHARFELALREAVGIGSLPSLEDRGAVLRAIDEAGATDLLSRLEHGLETRLGTSYGNGQDLSGGEWQKVALARALMRRRPLLLILDEPTAALDAQAEQAMFERYAERARAAAHADGAITLLVSHRFSTVRMADIIVVLEDGRVAEVGTHDQLRAGRGTYAELFDLQARSYAP